MASHKQSENGKHTSIIAPSGGPAFSPLRLAIVVAVFAVYAALVVAAWRSLPPPLADAPSQQSTAAPVNSLGSDSVLAGVGGGYAFPPRNLEDAKALGRQLSAYTDSNYWQLMAVYVLTYIFLQTFTIPGSIFLSILSGALFHFAVALFLVCLCAAAGATNAFLLSAFLGKGLVEKHMAERLATWRKTIEKHRSNLFNYILFLRITPLVPNFFINISSPIVGVPISTFFLGTFIGVGPPSVLWIRAGWTLQQMTTTAVPTSTFVVLVLLGFVSLLPVLFKEKIAKKFQ